MRPILSFFFLNPHCSQSVLHGRSALMQLAAAHLAPLRWGLRQSPWPLMAKVSRMRIRPAGGHKSLLCIFSLYGGTWRRHFITKPTGSSTGGFLFTTEPTSNVSRMQPVCNAIVCAAAEEKVVSPHKKARTVIAVFTMFLYLWPTSVFFFPYKYLQ